MKALIQNGSRSLILDFPYSWMLKDNPDFLNSDSFDLIERVAFLFDWNTEDLFGLEVEG